MSEKNRIIKATGIIMISVLVSRILGFIREQIMAGYFGQSGVTDAYFAAFTIPDLLYNLLIAGALSSAFIPVFKGYLANDRQDEAWRAASTFINLTVILLITGIILGIIFTPQLLPLVAGGFQGETLDLAVALTRIMFPAALFSGLNAFLMGMLNSYNHFAASSIGAVLYNVGIIATGLLLSRWIGVAGFSAGVLVGVVASFILQLATLLKIDFRYQPVIDLKNPGFKKIIKLMLPALIALSVSEINLIINQNFASALDPGSITALRLANRIIDLPLAVFVYSVSVALFPVLTGLAATDKMNEFRENFSSGLKSVLFIAIPAAAGLVALRKPIIRLLFEIGAFSRADTETTALALLYYSLGLIGLAVSSLCVKACYAIESSAAPAKAAAATVLLNIIFCKMLVQPLGHGGLALAYSLTALFNMIILLNIINEKIPGLKWRPIWLLVGKAVLAAAIMAVVSYGVSSLFEHNNISKPLQLLQVFTSIGAGAASYFLLAWLLKIKEFNQLLKLVNNRIIKNKKKQTV